VSNGTLLVTGSTAAGSAVAVQNGATLGGSGTISGPVTVANGATVSPGNGGGGTLTVGPTVFNGTSTLATEVGVPTDVLAVQGNLTLDGTVNVTLGTGGGPDVYTIMTYSGALTNNTLALGTTPAGYTPSVLAGSGTVQLTLSAASTTTVTAAPVSPTLYGQLVTFTATVAPLAPAIGVANGTVTFTVDGLAQAPVALVSNTATLSLAALEVGAHTIQADYNGTVTLTASSGTVSHTVNQAQTKTTLVSSANPSVDGVVVLTATVSPVTNGGVPTGTMTFLVNGTVQPAVMLTGGVATIGLSLNSGVSTIQANYSGSINYEASTATLSQVVRPFFNSPPTLTPNPAVVGLPINAIVGVGNAEVTWYWGDGTSGSGTTLSHIYTAAGNYTVTVTATAGGEVIIQTMQVFVGFNLEGVPPDGSAVTPPGVTGILVGGTGAGAEQGGSGKISCNYIRREKTYYQGSLGALNLPTTLTQASLINQPGTFTIGTSSSTATFRFDLNKRGSGKSTGLPLIEFNTAKKRFKFKAQRADLTDLTEALGGPQQFGVKQGEQVTLMVPVTLQIGNQVFLALTFQLNYRQLGTTSGKGGL